MPLATDQFDTTHTWKFEVAYFIVESLLHWQALYLLLDAPWRALIPQEPILYTTEVYALVVIGRSDRDVQIVEKSACLSTFPREAPALTCNTYS